MKIPKKIKIINTEYTVEFDDQYCDRENYYGVALKNADKIVLRNVNEELCTKSQQEKTFFHECIHIINFILRREKDECDSEAYVHPVSEMIHQIVEQLINENNKKI